MSGMNFGFPQVPQGNLQHQQHQHQQHHHQQQQHQQQRQKEQQLLQYRQQHERQMQKSNSQQIARGSPGSTSLTRPPDLMKPPKSIQRSKSLTSVTPPSLPLSTKMSRHESFAVPSTKSSSSVTKTSKSSDKSKDPSSSPSSKRDSVSSAAIPPPPALTTEQVQKLLNQCDWRDKTVYVAKNILGGSTLNGFLRATTTTQRMKKQRMRQVKSTKGDDPQPTPSEEELKREIMNARTAKKIRTEMMAGLEFCKLMHGTIGSILKELNPSHVLPPLMDINGSIPYVPPPVSSPVAVVAATTTTTKSASPSKTQKRAVSPGDPSGSTLRRERKRKFAEIVHSDIPDVDSNGKRFPKKEYQWRVFRVLRFRALRKGDYVAARLSSRDLWILAQVQQPYPDLGMRPSEFLQLTDTKRDALFRDKVVVRDHDEKDSGRTYEVGRKFVLPLARSYEEAADWGSRLKKGSRVYCMYPTTTSLYAATVIDNSTYCRGDDDIIVVEFDGDEADVNGSLPRYHIPARFVTLIPKEFQVAQPPKKKRPTLPSSQKTKEKEQQSQPQHKKADSDLNGFLNEMTYADLTEDIDFGQFDLLNQK